MLTITITELENNIDKYIELGQKEEIEVTSRDKVIFTIVPRKERLKEKWASIFGSLEGETIDEDVDRE
jgi:antitoxin (DNA-binding transcriptional repressor) of toxin-antitoxin stability system